MSICYVSVALFEVWVVVFDLNLYLLSCPGSSWIRIPSREALLKKRAVLGVFLTSVVETCIMFLIPLLLMVIHVQGSSLQCVS